MTTVQTRLNPFPGLRPFEPDEDHLFFGREKEIDELLRRLRSTRFLSVVGTSGSGKSSLIRCGLITALYSGLMVKARASWRVAVIRPGEDPIGNLAAALARPDMLGTDPDLVATAPVLLEATLRRSSRGLADAVRMARIPEEDNVLVVVDQFEELFRFRRNRRIDNSRDEAIAFVKLLLEGAAEQDLPIYIALTMRSDFIGDCMEYPGLAEAVNGGQYLVPRMDRDALRAAITGPIAVAGGTIAPRLVLRVLNDFGDDPNQLPVFQHALMRTWDCWIARRQPDQPIDIADYERAGTLREALSLHAEETFRAVGSERHQQFAERMFKALTDTFSDPRGIRRPTTIAELAAICETTEADVTAVVDVFRQPGRSFLMPPITVTLTPQSIVDLSHESLMRCWTRLIDWAEAERTSAAFYVRLSQAAAWHAQGLGRLWDAPELDLALQWKHRTKPTEAWARRFGDSFASTMAFLDRSAAERDRLRAEREGERRRKLQRAREAAAVFGMLFVIAGVLAYLAWAANRRAETNLELAHAEKDRAETNLRLARAAVEETLSSAQIDPERAGADVPQMSEFRRELLEKAKRYYVDFLKQNPRTLELRTEMALAHFRLGHISRSLDKSDDAAEEYERAIEQFTQLDRERPSVEYKRALANAYNWLGETLRPLPDRKAAAVQAYDRAHQLQAALVAAHPGAAAYRQELARTHYNRGIVHATAGEPGDSRFSAAETDFRQAVRLLEPLADQNQAGTSVQELARAYNNLANLIAMDGVRLDEAQRLYDRAIQIDERLLAADSGNQQYKLELAQFRKNAADVLREQGRLELERGRTQRARDLFERARRRNTEALDLLSDGPRPAPLLAIELADAHHLRGRILESARSARAIDAYEQSLRLFESLARDPAAIGLEQFHIRLAELLLSVAAWTRDDLGGERVRRLLIDSVDWYVGLANRSLAAGSHRNALTIMDNLSRLLPELDERDRRLILKQHPQLQERLASGK